MTSIVISRFLIDLQAVHKSSVETNLASGGAEESGTVVFARFIGSLNATIEFGGSLSGTSREYLEESGNNRD